MGKVRRTLQTVLAEFYYVYGKGEAATTGQSLEMVYIYIVVRAFVFVSHTLSVFCPINSKINMNEWNNKKPAEALVIKQCQCMPVEATQLIEND